MGCLKKAAAMFGIRRGDYPEPPPSQVASLGVAPGFTVKLLPSTDAVNAACLADGTNSYSEYNPHNLAGCTDYAKKTVYAPAPSVKGQDYTDAVLAHEGWHTWGAQHAENGRGWTMPDPISLGAALPQATDAQKAILKSFLPDNLWHEAQIAQAFHFPATTTDPGTQAIHLAKTMSAPSASDKAADSSEPPPDTGS